jgi:pimeloyl-ACP methyl ester carboxylesterase
VLGIVTTFFILPTLGVVVFDIASNGEMKPATALYGGPFVEADGTQLAYRTWGEHGSPVVLLGGAAEPSWVWHDVGPRLAAAGHRVYAVDLPPFGYSERRGPYTMAHWLQLLEGFERRLHIKRPVIVGHSLGAGVAAGEGLARPRDVAGVVLLDGDALRFGGGHGWISDLLVYPFYTAIYRVATGSDALVGGILSSAWGPNAPQFSHATIAEFERPFRVDGTDGALKQMAGGGIPGLTRAELARLRVPRLVLRGADDTTISLADGRATAAVLHTRLVNVAGAGHLSMLARPGAVAQRILAFMRSPG